MKFYIKHSMKGRIRVHMDMKRMTYKQADILEYYLKNIDSVYEVKVYEKTCDAVISYTNDKNYIIKKVNWQRRKITKCQNRSRSPWKATRLLR